MVCRACEKLTAPPLSTWSTLKEKPPCHAFVLSPQFSNTVTHRKRWLFLLDQIHGYLTSPRDTSLSKFWLQTSSHLLVLVDPLLYGQHRQHRMQQVNCFRHLLGRTGSITNNSTHIFWQIARIKQVGKWGPFQIQPYTLPETNSSPLKMGRNPTGKDPSPIFIHFQRRTCC